MTADSNRYRKTAAADGIAIVGMSARFPGCRTVKDYWSKLSAGENLLSTPSADDLLAAGIDPATAEAMHLISSGTILEDAEAFDAKLFGMTRREAEMMDPQQRVFLECAYEALEDAGIAVDGERDGSRVGVFGGIGMNTYMLQLLGNPELLAAAGGYQLMLGNDKDFLATRVAFKLNLTGPAVAVQTACSTSLAAVHLACQSLRAGECDAALAGGVSIAFPQVAVYPYIPGMILSPDGVCRPFDENARGTVPGRGAGLVVLKRLADAEAAGDTIYAVIAGSAWNNDGAAKVGYTAPSVSGQAEVIRAAHAAAGVTADQISYVEAHGTGTELGDPIEVAALAQVFGTRIAGSPGCVLGSVKANMGHADVAAGIAGLIKAALAIHHGSIPGTPHFTRANPALGLDRTPFRVSAESSSWPDGEREHWAGVSSFGIGGTNVHVCLRGVEREQSSETSQAFTPRIFPLSAATPNALRAMELRLQEFVAAISESDLAPVASTLQSGRRSYPYRRAVVAASRDELAVALASERRSGSKAEDGANGSSGANGVFRCKLAFLFPGQGQQFDGMAVGLYEADAEFRAWIDRGLASLPEELSVQVLAAIRGTYASTFGLPLVDTSVAQPLLFLVEYALAMRWVACGIRPDALLGHSLGELTAATVAGVFTFDDGMRLAAVRGRLMQETPEGAMLAVSLPVDEVGQYLSEDLWIAAENAPKLTVLSGSADAIARAEQQLKRARVASVRLQTNRAFHAPGMAAAAASFRREVALVERKTPTLPWLSNVTGTWITAEEAMSPEYWSDQMTSRVRFAENAALLSVGAQSSRILLEVGPGDALGTLARQQDRSHIALQSLGKGASGEQNKATDLPAFLSSAARLWEHGLPLAWEQLPGNTFHGRRRVSLPAYPFERERFWVEKTGASSAAAEASSRRPAANLEKRQDIASWFSVPSWQRTPAAAITNDYPHEPVATWLILSGVGADDTASLKSELASQLGAAGARATLLPCGSKKQMEEFFAEHGEAIKSGTAGLIFCAANSQSRGSSSGVDASVMDTVLEDYTLLLNTVQTCIRMRIRLAQLEIIAESLVEVHGELVLPPLCAVLEGVARILPVEFRGLATRTIDAGSISAFNRKETAASIVAEIQTIAPAGATVAYRGVANRGKTRWQELWLPVRIEETKAEEPRASRIRSGGTYVITGGLGGVGHALARHLASSYGVNLAVIGRTELPPRGVWEEWLTEHGPQHSISKRINRVKDLEAGGGRVLVLNADVADEAEMETAWQEIELKFGSVHGVIHAAGLSSSERFVAQSAESVATVLRPKVQGSETLARLLARRVASATESLDFLLFCSSISSIVPLAGATAYAGANAFQDRFATWCRQEYGLPAVVINFDGWQEVGMLAENPASNGFEAEREARLSLAMSTAEGIEIFERALASRENQLIVFTMDFNSALKEMYKAGGFLAEVEVSRPNDAATHSSVEAIGSESQAIEETLAVIAIWRELLGAEQVGPKDNFFELGGHSLVGTMVLARVREQFAVDLGIRAIFEAPTPESLGLRIHQAQPSGPLPMQIPHSELDEVAAGEDREDFEF